MSKEEIKTKSELMDSFVQLAIAKGYSDYSGDAERFINETVSVYENLPECKQPKLSIPKKIAEELEEYDAGEKGNYSLFGLSAEAREFYLTHNNIVTIYFASKALGVELVEVTDE